MAPQEVGRVGLVQLPRLMLYEGKGWPQHRNSDAVWVHGEKTNSPQPKATQFNLSLSVSCTPPSPRLSGIFQGFFKKDYIIQAQASCCQQNSQLCSSLAVLGFRVTRTGLIHFPRFLLYGMGVHYPGKMASVGGVREGLNTGTLPTVPTALFLKSYNSISPCLAPVPSGPHPSAQAHSECL